MLGLYPKVPRTRRSSSNTLQSIATLVSGSSDAYLTFIRLLQQSYAHTPSPDFAIALLRGDLSMCLLERKDPNIPISKWDPSFSIAACVDLACRVSAEEKLEKKSASGFDRRLLHQLHSKLETIGLRIPAELSSVLYSQKSLPQRKRGRDAVAGSSEIAPRLNDSIPSPHERQSLLADAAMLLSALPNIQELARGTLARLDALVDESALPANDDELCALIPLMVLSTQSSSLLRGETLDETAWTRLVLDLVTRTIPMLTTLIVDLRIKDLGKVPRKTKQETNILDIPMLTVPDADGKANDNFPTPHGDPILPASSEEEQKRISELRRRLSNPISLRLFLLIAARRVAAGDAFYAQELLSITVIDSLLPMFETQIDTVRSLIFLLQYKQQLRTEPMLNAILVKFIAPVCTASYEIHRLMLDFIENICDLPRKAQSTGIKHEFIQIKDEYKVALVIGRDRGQRDDEGSIDRRYELLSIDVDLS